MRSNGQTHTTNMSMTLCDWQIRQTHVLCGCTTFGTEFKLGTKLIRSLRLLLLGQRHTLKKGGGGTKTLVPILDTCSCLVHLPPHGGLLIGGPGNGAPPPSKSSPYAIIYSPRAETKHTSKVYDAALLKDRLGELIRAVILLLIHHGCFAKLGPLQGFDFFTRIH